jgi:hypothetical protein
MIGVGWEGATEERLKVPPELSLQVPVWEPPSIGYAAGEGTCTGFALFPSLRRMT